MEDDHQRLATTGLATPDREGIERLCRECCGDWLVFGLKRIDQKAAAASGKSTSA